MDYVLKKNIILSFFLPFFFFCTFDFFNCKFIHSYNLFYLFVFFVAFLLKLSMKKIAFVYFFNMIFLKFL